MTEGMKSQKQVSQLWLRQGEELRHTLLLHVLKEEPLEVLQAFVGVLLSESGDLFHLGLLLSRGGVAHTAGTLT